MLKIFALPIFKSRLALTLTRGHIKDPPAICSSLGDLREEWGCHRVEGDSGSHPFIHLSACCGVAIYKCSVTLDHQIILSLLSKLTLTRHTNSFEKVSAKKNKTKQLIIPSETQKSKEMVQFTHPLTLVLFFNHFKEVKSMSVSSDDSQD